MPEVSLEERIASLESRVDALEKENERQRKIAAECVERLREIDQEGKDG